MYSNYIFDLYGTILDIQTHDDDLSVWEDLSIYLSYNDCSYTPIQLRLHIEQAKQKQLLSLQQERDIDIADYDLEACFHTLQTRDGIQIDGALASSCMKMYRSLTLYRLQVYEGAAELLRALKQQGKRAYILCNGQKAFVEPELKLLGLYDLFDGIAVSSEAGCAKPDPGIFQYLSQTYDVDLSRSLWIEDTRGMDMEGARSAHVDLCYVYSDEPQDTQVKMKAKHQIKRTELQRILEL